MNKRKIASLMLMAILVLSLVACGGQGSEDGSAGSDGPVVWRLSHFSTTDHNWHKGAEELARLVDEKTDGKVNIEIYPNSELGSEVEALNGILSGTVDMTITGESMSNWVPVADIMGAPYVFRDENHIIETLDTEIGDYIKEELTAGGFRPLVYQLRTPRNLTSNKMVSTPEDAKGIRIRLPNAPLSLAVWEEVGANVNVMALDEVFTALNQNVIDSQENPYDLIYTSSFYEVQEYANETEHVVGFLFFVVGDDQFNALDEETQAQVMEACAEAQEYMNELHFETRDDYKDLLIEAGMTINENVDKDAFREAMAPAIEAYFEPEIYDIYQQIVELGQ